MEYQVPQFIEVEDKIIGPLTLKQFIYIAGTIGICVLFLFELPTIFAVILCVPIAALGIALSFYKVNGKPFISIMEAGFNYLISPKLFLWKRPEAPPQKAASTQPTPVETERPGVPKLTRGKLSELAWSLDVKKTNQGDLES